MIRFLAQLATASLLLALTFAAGLACGHHFFPDTAVVFTCPDEDDDAQPGAYSPQRLERNS